MIELQNICWETPEGRQILRNVNLKLRDNRLIAISGPNGSGKTTLARILMGIEKPSSGRILLDGEDITELTVTERAQKGISFGFQQPVSFKGITARRILKLAAGRPVTEENLRTLVQKVGLNPDEYLDREIDATLSGGEMKRIEIATVLARNTAVAVFDEPEAGIDLWSFEKLIGIFEQMRTEHSRTLIIISHQERILRIADEIVLIAGGTVKDRGAGPEMMGKMMQGRRAPMQLCGEEEVKYG